MVKSGKFKLRKNDGRFALPNRNFITYSLFFLVILCAIIRYFFLVSYDNLSQIRLNDELVEVDTRLKEKFLVANKLYAEGQYIAAVELYESIIRSSEDNPSFSADVYSNLASAYSDFGDTKKAEVYYKQALSLNSNHLSALFNLAMLYQDSRDLLSAVTFYEKYLTLNNQDGDVWSNLGACYHQLNNYEKAITCYENAVTHTSNKEYLSKIYEYLARIYLRIPRSANISVDNYSNLPVDMKVEQSADVRLSQGVDMAGETSIKGKLVDEFEIDVFNEGADVEADGDLVPQTNGTETAEYNTDQAIAYFTLSLEYNPQNPISLYLLQSLTQSQSGHRSSMSEVTGHPVEKASEEYVRQLFDDYSESFEESLQALQYTVPNLVYKELAGYLLFGTSGEVAPLLAQNHGSTASSIKPTSHCVGTEHTWALEERTVDNLQSKDILECEDTDTDNTDVDNKGEAAVSCPGSSPPVPSTYAAIVDLGCGTGLLGALVANHTDVLLGVDISTGMLGKAEARPGVYKYLFAGKVRVRRVRVCDTHTPPTVLTIRLYLTRGWCQSCCACLRGYRGAPLRVGALEEWNW